MIAVITKVSYTSDHENIDEWNQEMEEWKHNLQELFNERYENAKPTVLCISQDQSHPKRQENILNTP